MSRNSVTLLIVISLVVWAPCLTAAPVPQPNPERVRKELKKLWEDLRSPDELLAARALLKLAARPRDTVPYLKEKLRPLKLSKERAKQLLVDLGSDDEKTMQAAFDEFLYFDPRLAWGDEELREALLDRPASRRMGAILLDLPADALLREEWHWNSPDNKVYRFNHGEEIQDRDVAIEVAGIGTQGRKRSWDRAVRAIALLEQLGTREAVGILKDVATGHPDAAPTKAAKVVLQRMKK